MKGYDIIGDIHGCAAALETLLADLGYRPTTGPAPTGIPNAGGLRRRPGRPWTRPARVLEIVKRMVDSGSAQIVMGNHEFNAIGYATEIRPAAATTCGRTPRRTTTSTGHSSSRSTDAQRHALHRLVQDDAAVAGPRRSACRARLLARAVDESR